MTFFAWVSMLARRGIHEPDPQHGTTSRLRAKRALVPPEYLALYHYLEHRYASLITLSFEQIESLTAFPLPAEARTAPAWWTGDVESAPHSQAWTMSGRTAMPNLSARNVSFERPL